MKSVSKIFYLMILFSPPIYLLGMSLNLANPLMIFAIASSVIIFKKNVLNQNINIILLLFTFLLFYSIVSGGIVNESTFEIKLIRNIILLYAIYHLINFFDETYTGIDILRLVSYFLVLNAVITLICLTDFNLQLQINQYIDTSMNESFESIEDTIRFNGIFFTSGASLSLLYSFFYVYFFTQIMYFRKHSFLLYISAIIIFISMMVTGRTGIVSMVLTYLILMVYFRRYIYFIPIIIGFIIVSYLVFLAANGYLDEVTTHIVTNAFEPIYRFYYSDTIVASSNQKLLEMLYLPVNEVTSIFGQGSMSNYTVPSGMRISDSGYVRMFHEHGIFIEFIFILSLLSISKLIRDDLNKKLYLTIIIILILFHIKEPFLYKPYMLAIPLSIYLIDKRKRNNEKNFICG